MGLGILFYRALSMLFDIVRGLILIRIFLEFIDIYNYNGFVELIYKFTEPILDISRRLLSKLGIKTGSLDFSPLVAFLILGLIEYLVERILF